MDMKRILQAMDGISTKPVGGANDMSKFLRIVSEAEINQPVAPAQPASTLPPDQIAYNQLRAQIDSLDAMRGEPSQNTFVDISPDILAKQNAMRQKLANMAAALKAKGIDAPAEYDAGMADMRAELNKQPSLIDKYKQKNQAQPATTPAPAQPVPVSETGEPADPNYQRYADLMAKYDLLQKEMAPDASGIEKGASPDAIAEINKIKAMAAQVAGPNLQAWEQARTASNSAVMAQAQANQPALAAQLEENSMAKFLSIIDKNNVKILTEGSNPHKVALPVQMAMQHYQQPNAVVEKKQSLLKQYFVEAEEEIAKKEVERQQLLKQYAHKIANRVLVKENILAEKSTTEKQARTMAAAAHDPEFAKKVDIKTSVAKEFNKADTGTKLLSQAMKKKKKKKKELDEASSPAQQAAIAISMKKAGKKPKNTSKK